MKISKLVLFLHLMVISCTTKVSNNTEEIAPNEIANDTVIENLLLSDKESIMIKEEHSVNNAEIDSMLDILNSITTNATENIDTNKIISFIEMYNEYPFSYIEIGEYANEILYLLFDKKTALIMKVLRTKATESQFNNIILDLQNPICDTFNICNIVDKVEKVSMANKYKNDIIGALKDAQLHTD